MTLLSAHAVNASRGSRPVLHDVDLSINAGEVVAVLGPNGAGKSTLLDVLGGQLRATSGTIACQGRVATALQSPDLARRSAHANVELALSWWGVPRAARRARATAALVAMQAEHLAQRPASTLSGGERRRVHLARALALEPDVLLLDEPFAGLDSAARSALLDDTASALRSTSRAVVVVVHDRAEAWALANRLVIVLAGRIAAEGSPQALLEAPPTVAVARFLGYTGELQIDGALLLTRPAHVQLGATNDRRATVTNRVPQQDGVLLDLITPSGHLQAVAPYPGPSIGQDVTVALTGGVRFPSG